MNLSESQDTVDNPSKRPAYLLVLIVLSSINIIGSALGAISGMLGARPDKEMIKDAKLEFANMREQLEAGGADDYIYIIDQMEHIAKNMFDHFQAYNTIQFLILLIGFTGVYLMYKGRKLGFHFYIIYSLGLVVLPYLFNPITGIPTILTLVGIVYGGIWVFLYGRNLHWMKD